MKYLTAFLVGVACLLAACDDKPKPGGPVPKATAAQSAAPLA